MERNNLMARLFRAISGKLQDQFADDIGVHRVTIADIERGEEKARPRVLERMAATVGLRVEDGEKILRLCDTLQKERVRAGQGSEDLLQDLEQTLRARSEAFYERLLRLPLPGQTPRPEDRSQAEERMATLQELDEPTRLLLIKVNDDYQTWALVERTAQAAADAAGRDLREARAWASLSVEIARRIRGTEGWRNRVLGFALAQEAEIRKMAGEGEAAAAFEEAKRLWQAGADPERILDGEVLVA